jgi:hypothetical protein
MGGYYAYTFIGVPADSVIRDEVIETFVTKYDENTGSPFQKKVVQTKRFFGTQEISEDCGVWDAIEELKQKYPTLLDVFGESSGRNNKWIGVPIYDYASEYDECRSIRVGGLEAAIEAARTEFAKFGCVVDLKIFTLMRYL